MIALSSAAHGACAYATVAYDDFDEASIVSTSCAIREATKGSSDDYFMLDAEYYWRNPFAGYALLTISYSDAADFKNIDSILFRIGDEILEFKPQGPNTDHSISSIGDLIPKAKYESKQKFKVPLEFLERLGAAESVKVRLRFLDDTYVNTVMTSQYVVRSFLAAVSEQSKTTDQ